MKYNLTRDQSKFSIKLESAEGEQEKLFKMLMSCLEGSCRPATGQYEALQSITISVVNDSGTVTFKAAAGKSIEKAAIDKCLQCTVKKVSQV